MAIYDKRRDKIYDWMARENIAMVMIEDCENRRDPALRWLSGQPSDGLFFMSVDRKNLLVPWDINMAMLYSQCDTVVPYSEFDRRPAKALKGAAEFLKVPAGSRIEIPSAIPYPLFLKYVEEITDYDILCRDNGVDLEIEKDRAVKDEEEISIYRKVSAMTCELTALLEKNVASGKLKTEMDVALFIETEARKRGCEGTGFNTLAAGPERSFGIHAFPPYTAGAFGTAGMSILDYGLKYMGYTSDATLTFAREPLVKQQEKMISLVEKAHSLAVSMIGKGVSCRAIALAVDAYFAKSKKTMPHALGHGIGLQAHEAPSVRSRADNEWVLEPGMIVTIEPGLYDPVLGGCRLENDVLITETGADVLTNSKIIRL
ncbi:MAG: Xaa-Pro peptidase family protein [Treponema sp.]|nr:Xaa-Pro peptidase family protein [Treponema sp.]